MNPNRLPDTRTFTMRAKPDVVKGEPLRREHERRLWVLLALQPAQGVYPIARIGWVAAALFDATDGQGGRAKSIWSQRRSTSSDTRRP